MIKAKVIASYNKSKLKGNNRLKTLTELSHDRHEKMFGEQTRLSLIQELIPLGLLYVEEALQEEVTKLAGQRYVRSNESLSRWGANPGSVYVGDNKLAVRVPRVRNTITGEEKRLSCYERLQTPTKINESAFLNVINGISTRKYKDISCQIPEVFGNSKSTISKRFIEESEKYLKHIMERDLSCYDIVAVLIDGKFFSKNEMIIAMGITISGEKIILGMIEGASESEYVCKDFIKNLLERGLNIDQEILFIIDGSKGLRKAINTTIKEKALIQRCQFHKRENVLSYLSKEHQELYKMKLDIAYSKETEAESRKELNKILDELRQINISAHNSLLEGLEETLTVQKLGVPAILRKSLKTTNCIESLNARLGQYTDKVDYWKNSSQRQRWVASALLEAEPTLRKLRGIRDFQQK